jgi:CRP/FNR family transcriptional regulator
MVTAACQRAVFATIFRVTGIDLSSELRRLPYFKDLPGDLLERLAAGSTARTFGSGETLFSQGDAARAFFFVRRGDVRLYRLSSDGHVHVLHHVRAGQSFGEAAVLSFRRYPAHAIAVEDSTEVVEIGAHTFLQVFRDDPRLSAAMVSSLCMRLHGLVERVEELSEPNAGARLARFLLRQPAQGRGDPLTIELSMAKKELAAHLAIVPETLSRLLRKWQDDGVLRSNGRVLEILDSTKLWAIADPGSRPGAA